jgi:hypothetical protein
VERPEEADESGAVHREEARARHGRHRRRARRREEQRALAKLAPLAEARADLALDACWS